MFNFLKKKKDEKNSEESGKEGKDFSIEEPVNETTEDSTGDTPQKSSIDENLSLASLNVQIEKLNTNFESFNEVRKSFTERMNHLSEEIGELRAMILERDKSVQEIELKAVKAYDLVDTVQPEKISINLQKQEAKIEALNANLEGHEAIIDRVMDELKKAKRKIEFFRGVEEIVKLSEETKKELVDLKKVESKITINADKVDTLYVEMSKKFQRIDIFDSNLQEMKVTGEQNMKDISVLKDKVLCLAEKSELERLINKFQRYVEVLKKMEKKSSMTKDIDKLKNILETLG